MQLRHFEGCLIDLRFWSYGPPVFVRVCVQHFTLASCAEAMASLSPAAEWTADEEVAFQTMLEKRSRQAPIVSLTGAMSDGSKRRAEDVVPDDISEWGGVEICHHAPVVTVASLNDEEKITHLLPTGVPTLEKWGKTIFAFGKNMTRRVTYHHIYSMEASYVDWSRKHLGPGSSKGPALDWYQYIQAADFIYGKPTLGVCYTGTTVQREFGQ